MPYFKCPRCDRRAYSAAAESRCPHCFKSLRRKDQLMSIMPPKHHVPISAAGPHSRH